MGSARRQADRIQPTRPIQLLLKNGSSIIANLAQQVSYLNWQILINFEFHCPTYAGIATTRSRANSAAYVIAACTASRLKDG